MTCDCGHDPDQHCHGIGRCDGQCHDSEYGTYKCLCPYFTEEKL